MKIYLGADHNGYPLKEKLEEYLESHDYDVEDLGDKGFDQEDDFPIYASKVATAVLGHRDKSTKGIVLCGSGQGVCMTVNRFKGIRGSLCWDATSAREARNDDDANVLCLPAKILSEDEAIKIVDAWLNTEFAGALRFKRRIKQLDEF